MRMLPHLVPAVLVLGLAVLHTAPARADGMVPQTSVVVIDEADGEATINVLNTDNTKALLHSVILDVEEDPHAPTVIVTPPLAHVGAGKTQQVRLLLDATEPLKRQHLRRVTFEGIPPADNSGTARVAISFRQNLPVIIHPRGLERNQTPWTQLAWSLQGNTLTVSNTSPYVVRMNAKVTLLPSGTTVELPRTFVLPGDTFSAAAPQGSSVSADSTVRISPATVYGYAVEHYDATLQRR